MIWFVLDSFVRVRVRWEKNIKSDQTPLCIPLRYTWWWGEPQVDFLQQQPSARLSWGDSNSQHGFPHTSNVADENELDLARGRRLYKSWASCSAGLKPTSSASSRTGARELGSSTAELLATALELLDSPRWWFCGTNTRTSAPPPQKKKTTGGQTVIISEQKPH